MRVRGGKHSVTWPSLAVRGSSRPARRVSQVPTGPAAVNSTPKAIPTLLDHRRLV